jgi:hypothetical protein
MKVTNKLVHGIILGDVETIEAQYKSFCKARSQTHVVVCGKTTDDRNIVPILDDEDDDYEEAEQHLMDGVLFGSFTLVCVNGTALLYQSENATSNLNINIDEDEAYFAWARGGLNDEAAANLQNALNKAAKALTGQTQHKSLVTLSLVLAYDD